MEGSKRIIILTADAGFGHRSAANAIAAALRETHGDQCTVEIINPLEDRRAPAILRESQSDYDRIVREMPDLYKVGFNVSDRSVSSALVENVLTVMLFDVMRSVIKRRRPDAIISTYPFYQAPLRGVYAIRNHYVPLITVITDLVTVHRLWMHEASDYCLVPTPAVREMALDYGLLPHKVIVTGIPVYPSLAGETRPKPELRTELGWQPEMTTLLAVGSARGEHLVEAMRILNHSRLPIQLAIVAGGDDNLYFRLRQIDWHLKTYIYNFVDNMPALLKAADSIVCKAGGLIVTEALAAGLPLVLTDVLPGQEMGNAEYVVQGEAGEMAPTGLEALEIMYHWLDDGGKLLARRAANAQALGRPRAAYEVAERAWMAAQAGPQVKKLKDILGLTRLRVMLRRFNIAVDEKTPSSSDEGETLPIT